MRKILTDQSLPKNILKSIRWHFSRNPLANKRRRREIIDMLSAARMSKSSESRQPARQAWTLMADIVSGRNGQKEGTEWQAEFNVITARHGIYFAPLKAIGIEYDIGKPSDSFNHDLIVRFQKQVIVVTCGCQTQADPGAIIKFWEVRSPHRITNVLPHLVEGLIALSEHDEYRGACLVAANKILEYIDMRKDGNNPEVNRTISDVQKKLKVFCPQC
jgi:hypothetical protein